MIQLLIGDAREKLAALEPESINALCTSPPYYGLRSYLGGSLVWGGDASCAHAWGAAQQRGGPAGKQGDTSARRGRASAAEQAQQSHDLGCWCQQCGAWRGSLGLEPSPELYVEHLVEIFRIARKALRKDGTLWLNLGDSYSAAPKGSLNGQGKSGLTSVRTQLQSPAGGLDKRAPRIGKSAKAGQGFADVADAPHRRTPMAGIKPKDLIGIPWMVAFALRADGWYLRSDIVWSKVNGMPESVKDRPTRAHEFVFLLSKSSRYYYDYRAVRRPLAASSIARLEQPTLEQQNGSSRVDGGRRNGRPMKAVKFGGNKRMGGETGANLGAFRDAERERERERVQRRAHAQRQRMEGALTTQAPHFVMSGRSPRNHSRGRISL